MSAPKPILICGAGISGLAFAQGLLRHSIPFRIFERDPALNVRSQGYRVRIHSAGIDALRQVLSPALFARLEASCAQTTGKGPGPPVALDALTAKQVEFGFGPAAVGRRVDVSEGTVPLNADRSVLRSVLMRGLEGFVEFGREFEAYEIVPGGVEVRFVDGGVVEGSLLVGADGTKSRIRKQLLPDHRLVDTEGRWFYGKTTLTPELLEGLNANSVKGLLLVRDTTKEVPLSLLFEPVKFKDNEFRGDLPEDYVYWVLGSRKDWFEMNDAQLLKLTPEEAAAETQKLTAHWDPSIRILFAMQDVSKTSILRIDSARPELPVWKTQASVTLIGDSIHAMSPTAGVGAVTALRSAASLAKIIGEDGISIGGLRKYEDEMREVAGTAIKMSFFGGKMLFGMREFAELKDVTS